MLQGLTYAYGDSQTVEATPSSAFSKGDILMLDSTSSVSRIAELFPSGTDIFGIAETNSNDSVNGKCLVRIPGANTAWLASLSTALTSHATPGVEADISFAVANGRSYVNPASANSVRVAVIKGTAGPGALDQSVHSQVLVQLITNAGNLEIS